VQKYRENLKIEKIIDINAKDNERKRKQRKNETEDQGIKRLEKKSKENNLSRDKTK